MHAVSNTSPLIFLESLDVLFLLDRCFEKVIIADAVYREWGPSSIPSFVEHYHLSEKGAPLENLWVNMILEKQFVWG